MNKSTQFKIIFGLLALIIFLYVSNLFFVYLINVDVTAMPWTGFEYLIAYPDNSEVIKNLLISHGVIGFLGLIVLFFVFFKAQKSSLFGDASWANDADLKNADPSLRGDKGIVIGRFNGKYMIQKGQQFTSLIAPTRSKKGVSVVIPNCLSWHDSLVVTDIKLENYKISSGYRESMGQKVFLFNPAPTDLQTHRWNPLAYITDDANFRIDDIQKIANFLMPNPEKGDPMWASEGRDIFMGVVLYLMDNKEGYPVTMGEVFRQMRTEKPTGEYLQEILDDTDNELDSNCISAISKFINLPDKQQEGVKSTLMGCLNLWANPVLDAATAANDFDFSDLRKKKMTIFVGITPDNLTRLSPVLNLFFQQLVDINTRNLPNKKTEPYSVLLLMDELPALGNLSTIINGVGYIAGYNLRLLSIAQDLSQYVATYGKEKAMNFIKNHATKIFFAPNSMEDAEMISKELGNMTVKNQSVSKPSGFAKKTTSTSEASRALLLPQEIKEIGQNKNIVVSENCKPILGDKIIYFQDDDFLKRCIAPENMKAVKKSKDQETFLSLVRTPSKVPDLEVQAHVLRGAREVETTYEIKDESTRMSNGEEVLLDEEAKKFADDWIARFENSN